MGYSPSDKQHFWTAVCDEKGNQIENLVYCDRCGKTFHSNQLTPEGTIRKGEKPIQIRVEYHRVRVDQNE